MEKRFQPGERLPVLEDDLGDGGTVDRAGVVEDAGAELLEQRAPDVRVLAQQLVDDVVARDRRGAMARERLQRLRLPGPDSPRDRDRDGSGSRSRFWSSPRRHVATGV
jgi:hypothetical protein